MNIDSIKNGIVLDHIRAGQSMEIYRILELGELDCTVAIIKNVNSLKMGKKDIIKIDAELDLDLAVLGYIDPGITVNIIKNGEMVEKRHLRLPDEVRGVIKCKNPRAHNLGRAGYRTRFSFGLRDRENRVYRCIYCESKAK